MTFILIGALTITVVSLVNKVIVTSFSEDKIIYLIPLVEEIAKTGIAIYFGQSILLNHAFFGAVEALDDLRNNKNRSPYIGLVGFLGHFIFGLITITAIGYFKYTVVGIITAYIVHAAWNYLVIKLGKS